MSDRIEFLINKLLQAEDTDQDNKITVEDSGPKEFKFELNGNQITVKGTYNLSNLLQELVLLKNEKKELEDLKLFKIDETPAVRISRMIKEYYWDGLSRSIDEKGLEKIVSDSKSSGNKIRIYVPFSDRFAFDYFQSVRNNFELNLEVVRLPEKISSEYVNSINPEPGILSLALKEKNGKISGNPFVVPGSRFNEMYGWDSYFQNIGLILDGKIELAKSVVENFQYEIKHYGKVLNANRSYYLTRTQPPFFSSMIREVHESLEIKDIDWLEEMLKTCILEYETVWMNEKTHLCENGLNRFFAEGFGMPWETEQGHFDAILLPFAQNLGYELGEFTELYKNREISVPELDEYFVHDRTVRESGHDTTYRFEGICADIQPVELNSMLYKYEMDLAEMLSVHFPDGLYVNEMNYQPEYFAGKAKKRKELMEQFFWDENLGMYFDYNFKKKEKNVYWSATGFFPLWVGIPNPDQLEKLKVSFEKFMQKGGILSSLHPSPENAPARQWDFPNGWAPHQIIIWKGLKRYGENDLLQQSVYSWLWNLAKNAAEYNGVIAEKYNVLDATHKVSSAEYGNQGTEFSFVSSEGFGWTNASFQFGLSLLEENYRTSLEELVPPFELFKKS